MALDDLFELIDLLEWWRLFLGLLITAVLILAVLRFVDGDTLRWVLCVPIGAVGVFLSFRWQIRSDKDRRAPTWRRR